MVNFDFGGSPLASYNFTWFFSDGEEVPNTAGQQTIP
jgi:hypothetical protein